MTPAEQDEFIRLWTAGTDTAAMAQQLGIPKNAGPAGYVEQDLKVIWEDRRPSAERSRAETPRLTSDEAKGEGWNLWLPRGLRQCVEAVVKARGHAPSKVVQETL